MIILSDIDEILYSLIDEGIEIYNKKYNKQLKPSDITEYTVSKELLECMGEVNYTRGDKDNSVKHIKELIAMGHDVYLITASMKENLMDKIKWVERHLPEIGYDKMIICKNKHLVHGDVLIDDYEWNIIGHPAKYKFLVDAPHNKHVLESDKIIRVKDLSKVVEFLRGV